MEIAKFTFFSLLLLFLKTIPLSSVEIRSKLDDSNFTTRAIYMETDYSFCFLGNMDTRIPETGLDFSFKSRLIRAGRIKRMGIWRELFNPLKVSANSDMFSESPGFGKDFAFHSGGLYGLSIGVENGANLSILITDNLWIGGNYTIVSDPFLITAILSTVKCENNSSDDWTGNFPIVPLTNPIHLGMQSILQWNNLKVDFLGVLSGSSIYKAGSYKRLHIELLWEKLQIKSIGGITSPDFINTDVNLSVVKYLIGLWIGIYPNRNWVTVFKLQYDQNHLPVLPAAFVPTSGSSGIKLKFDNSIFNFVAEPSQKFDFDSNGNRTVKNKFDSRIGISGQLSAAIGLGFSSDFDSLTERRLEFELKGSNRGIDVEFVFKLTEEIYEPVNQYMLRLNIDKEFGTGSAFFKVEIGNGWQIEGLTIGFKTTAD